MGKPTICICENKGADQLRGNVTAKLISAFVFAIRIVLFLFYLNPKFQASSSFLRLYMPVCVGPVRRPHCRFSHEEAQIGSPCHEFKTFTRILVTIWLQKASFLREDFRKWWIDRRAPEHGYTVSSHVSLTAKGERLGVCKIDITAQAFLHY